MFSRRTLLAATFATAAAFTALPAHAQVAADRSVGIVLNGVNEEGGATANTIWRSIAAALRKDPAIRLAEDPAMEAVAGKTMTAQDAGAAMKVRYVLTGGVTAGSHAYKFELKLLDAKDGKQLWNTNFLNDEDGILALPTEVAGALIPVIKAAAL
jgi:TolB-like protein